MGQKGIASLIFIVAAAGLITAGVVTFYLVNVKDETNTAATISVDKKNTDSEQNNKKETVKVPVNITNLPLGDGNYSTSPKKGYVYSCQTSFAGGGSEKNGAWISGNTWDLTKKISVLGKVNWSNAKFELSNDNTFLEINGNGLPVGYPTGIFPIQISDPAYEFDRNPNSIKAQEISYQLPKNPQSASKPSCVPMGSIGYSLNGVAIYNALDAGGRDAVAHEVQDSCSGHPQQEGEYHYHGPSDCMPNAEENNALVGYALDGFGIFSMKDGSGNEYTNEDLDECHGLTSEIEWNGQKVNMYHYVLTHEYPYTVGCFKGTPVKNSLQENGFPPKENGGSLPPKPEIMIPPPLR